MTVPMREQGRINIRVYLGIPEMGSEVVGLLPELECDDFAHFELI